MIKIKTAFTLLFGFVILSLIIILVSFVQLLKNRQEFGKSQFDRFHSINLSDNLRERNDDLTHYCMNYIITGDSIWEKAYQDLVQIADESYPINLKNIHLLEDSLKQMGYGGAEFNLLQEAIYLSETLLKRENEAFYAAKGWFADSTKDYTIRKKPDRDKALAIISHKNYLETKRRVIKRIKLFEQRVEENANKIREQNAAEGFRLYHTVLLLISFVLLFSCIAFYMIYKRVNAQEKLDLQLRKNITELQKTQKELLKSEERFTLAVKGAEAIIWDYSVQDQLLLWSPKDCNLLDYTNDEIQPSMAFLIAHLHPDDKNRFEQHLNTHIENGSPLNIDARFYNKQKKLRWYRCKGSSSRDGANRAIRIVGIFTDITEQVRQEEKVMNAILETEDKERSRIAREIHDSLQQTMSTALLNFEKVRSSVVFEDEMIRKRFQTGYRFLKDSISESRTLAHNLMPKVVDQNGVAAAIEALVNAMKGSTSTELVFYHNLAEERMKVAAEMTIYRIVQEAINNVIKYAKAQNCTIQLLKHAEIVTLTIEDDGIGFIPAKTNNTLGLNSMKIRTDAIGGFLQIESAPGKGTQILFEITL
ncbi:PAS domain S-box protein [Marinilabiliaceae bacterium JC017]|nr:PAS domain S-box protein [Marinilabiliaceae bacterium JC017]